MVSRAVVRSWGANHRKVLVDLEASMGQAVGVTAARRFIWEAGEYLVESFDRPFAAETLFAAADAVSANLPVPEGWPYWNGDEVGTGEPDDVTAPAAPALSRFQRFILDWWPAVTLGAYLLGCAAGSN